MDVHALGWAALAAIIVTMIAIDIVGHVRTPHAPSMKEAAWWSVAYIAMAIVFGFIVWVVVVSRVKLGVAFAISGGTFYLLLAALTWLLYGERLTLGQWAGLALISSGVLMVSLMGSGS